jgi:RimJ/RimL family protein N-acetyltransferase
MTPPVLHTPRLTLRLPVMADFPADAAVLASPRAAFMGGPFGGRAARGRFCRAVACRQLFRHGGLAIVRKDTGATAGVVDIDAGPSFPETERGRPRQEGCESRGCATEAVQALRDGGFALVAVDSFVSDTDPDNHASQAVAPRLEAVIDAGAPVQDAGDIVWRHPRGRS